MQIQLYRYNPNGDHRLIGSQDLTILELLEANSPISIDGVDEGEYEIAVE
jgi:hypothetical protein